MSILEKLIEDAAGGATSAGAVAGFRSHLFGGDMANKKRKKKKKNTIIRRGPQGSVYGFHLVNEGYSFKTYLMETDNSEFDSSDVIAKLKSATKDAKAKGEDTIAFALEDEDGAMVKVWVPEDQAEDFQSALEQALSKREDTYDEDDTNDVEIAEILWSLRKDFDIINVEFGKIPEDQEETLPPDVNVEGEPGQEGESGEGNAQPEGGDGNAPADKGGDGEGGEGEMTAEPGEAENLGASEDDVKTTLQSVIDMMKADAEARRAESEAREKEAEATISKFNMQAASDKVKQEEETLDMETYYDNKKEEDDEAKRLAKLAKYRHDIASDNGASVGGHNISAYKGETEHTLPNLGEEEPNELKGREEYELSSLVHRPRYDSYNTNISKRELGDLILRALREK
jgi:hypothetical protein